MNKHIVDFWEVFQPPKKTDFTLYINSSLKLGLPDQVLGLLATTSLAANLLVTSLAQVTLENATSANNMQKQTLSWNLLQIQPLRKLPVLKRIIPFAQTSTVFIFANCLGLFQNQVNSLDIVLTQEVLTVMQYS